MEDYNLSYKLFKGKPIDIGFCDLIPYKLDEIFDKDFGFEKYNQYLSILCISSETLRNLMNIPDEINVEPYDYIYDTCKDDINFRKLIIDALSIFLRTKINFTEDGYFVIGDIIDCNLLHNANYNYFIEILKLQNCINKNPNDFIPKNEKEKEFFNELQAKRAKYAEKEQDIVDIMSAICSKHPSINVFNIGELTMFQLIDSYKRLNMIDEYFIGIKSLLAGAKKEEINLIHWSSKIK